MEGRYKKLIDQFEEVKDVIPLDYLQMKYPDQTMYGNVMDWCRDYFNEPKNPVLAYMLIGNWYTDRQVKTFQKMSI